MFCLCALRPFKLSATRTRNAADERQNAKSSNCACSDMRVLPLWWRQRGGWLSCRLSTMHQSSLCRAHSLSVPHVTKLIKTQMPCELAFAGHWFSAEPSFSCYQSCEYVERAS